MAAFSIPATFVSEDVRQLAVLNRTLAVPVAEVYGSLRGGEFGSGRKVSDIPKVSLDELAEYVAECSRNGIQFNYTFNFSCNGNNEITREGRDRLVVFGRRLLDIGIRRITVALPTVMVILGEFLPEFSVSVSVIAGVDSPRSLEQYLSLGNVRRVCIRESTNRNIPLLRDLCREAKSRNCEISTIVNTSCLLDCPHSAFHYNFGAHATGASDEFLVREFYGVQCSLFKLAHKEEFLKMPWIRPEEMQTYVDAGVDVFKISGREMRGPDFRRMVGIYNAGHYEGNLVDLLMCFTSHPYNEVFSVTNPELTEFMRGMLSNTSVTHGASCHSCQYCMRNRDLVSVSDKACDKWQSLLRGRLDSLLK